MGLLWRFLVLRDRSSNIFGHKSGGNMRKIPSPKLCELTFFGHAILDCFKIFQSFRNFARDIPENVCFPT